MSAHTPNPIHCGKDWVLAEDFDRLKADKERLLEALEAIDKRAQGKTNADVNIRTVWAVRKIARQAIAEAKKP